MRVFKVLYLAILTLALFPGMSFSNDPIIKLKIKGPIGPAKAEFIEQGFKEARLAKAKAIVLEMGTPGGLDTSMREIIEEILTSPIPVITYISPSGSRAASAGTYILYASHVAAMAPGTNLGASTPVAIGALPSYIPGDDKVPKKAKEEDSSRIPTMKEKVLNDAIAYMKSLAQLRKRNAEWAVKSITQADSITSEEAKSKKVIDFIAKDLSELMNKAHGKTVLLQNTETKLDLKEAKVLEFLPNWRIEFLEVITNPNMLYILMLIGVYGLLLEFMNPGFFIPGVIGGICLIIALYSMHILPVNYAGVGLILLGICFMVGEMFLPSLGVLGIGGVISFVLGSVFMMKEGVPGYEISWGIVGVMTLLTVIFIAMVMYMFLKSRKKPVVTGKESMVGKQGYVQTWEKGKGLVWLMGEAWEATGPDNLEFNDTVLVKKVKGLKVNVVKGK